MNRSRLALLVLVAIALTSLLGLGIAAAGEPDAGGNGIEARTVANNGALVTRCGTIEKGKAKDAPLFEEIQRLMASGRIAAGGVIPVNFHVIYYGSNGNVPQSWIDAQILVLNRNFAGKNYSGQTVSGAANTGYTFVLNSVTRTSNRKWFTMTPGSRNERDAKNTLCVNQAGSLNLYSASPGQNLLGWATFPWDLSANGKLDGVVIHYQSMPGGNLAPYNLGGTGSHEVGHWVGLYHTFQGGCGTSACTTTGDLVCDTPAEATPTSGCPSNKDTCTLPGLDPIHNYMDYSTDICYTQFTTGQDARADFMMSTYRPVIGSAARYETAALAGRFQAASAASAQFGLRAVPNPFNPRTKVEFSMKREGNALVRVFDIQGRTVATLVNARLAPGTHRYDLDGERLASGIYHVQLRIDGQQVAVSRLSLLK